MSDQRPNALPCIRCGKQLGQIWDQKESVSESLENQPYNGTAFCTNGHYGSTVFDSMHGETIEINVCDTCLLDAAKEGRILYYRSIKKTELVNRKFWVPDVNEEYVRAVDKREHGETSRDQR